MAGNSCLWGNPNRIEKPKLTLIKKEQTLEEIAKILKRTLESPPNKTVILVIKIKGFPVWQNNEHKKKRMDIMMWGIRKTVEVEWWEIISINNYSWNFTLKCQSKSLTDILRNHPKFLKIIWWIEE